MTNKDVLVRGKIPMSVRKQVKTAQSKSRARRTLKNKSIKKIKTPPIVRLTNKNNESKNKNVKSILQEGKSRTKHKTMKKVRFNLEAEGIQPDKFRSAKRVKMRTAKAPRDHSLDTIHRKKQHTLKKRGFKIRFSDNSPEIDEIDGGFTGSLIDNLKNVKNTITDDVEIKRV